MGLMDALRGKKHKHPPLDLGEVYDSTIKDLPEDRMPSHNPRLVKAINEFLALDNVKKGEIVVFEDEKRKMPDFYLPYYWIATYYLGQKNFQPAQEVLLEGIAHARTKSVLCRRLGEVYFAGGEVEKAVYWFCTAIMAGEEMDFHSYLYLGYMFDAYGMKEASHWARRRARGISYKLFYQVSEYSKKKMDDIKAMAAQHKSERAAQMLDTFYRHATKTLKDL